MMGDHVTDYANERTKTMLEKVRNQIIYDILREHISDVDIVESIQIRIIAVLDLYIEVKQ